MGDGFRLACEGGERAKVFLPSAGHPESEPGPRKLELMHHLRPVQHRRREAESAQLRKAVPHKLDRRFRDLGASGYIEGHQLIATRGELFEAVIGDLAVAHAEDLELRASVLEDLDPEVKPRVIEVGEGEDLEMRRKSSQEVGVEDDTLAVIDQERAQRAIVFECGDEMLGGEVADGVDREVREVAGAAGEFLEDQAAELVAVPDVEAFQFARVGGASHIDIGDLIDLVDRQYLQRTVRE